MSTPAGDEAVRQPLTIGSLTLRNRVAVTAHITGFADQGRVSPQLIDYHVGRARGGVGLIVTETGSVHESYRPQGLRYFEPGAGEGLARLADAVHAEGAAIVGQLNHGGAQAPPRYDGAPQWSASANDGQNGGSARAMTVAEIHEVTEAFVRSAVVLAEAGYDGCEVHGAHSYLLNHFLSPLYNRREDSYGGSFERRLRIVTEVLDGIRAAVDRSFVIGLRLGAEIGPGGLGSTELAEIGVALQDAGRVDYVSFSLGGRTPESMPLMTGTMDRPAGYELAWNELPSRALTVPTLVTGRFRSLAQASEILASGAADLVGMTRAHIADPRLVLTTVEHGADRVRPCIGCNECQAALLSTGVVRCAVNASLPGGRSPDEVAEPGVLSGSLGDGGRRSAGGRVLIAGGGPAGLEAARVAALRGYDVVLAEQGERLGGVARRAAERMPCAPGLAEITDWLEREVRRLGVDVQLGRRVDPEFVGQIDPDVVLVATGAIERRDGRQSARPGQLPTGLEQATLFTPTEALELGEDNLDRVGRHVLVVDDTGEYTAIGVSEYLLGLGCSVTVATPFFSLASPQDATYRPLSSLGRLAASDRFTVRPTTLLAGCRPGVAVLTYLPTSRDETVPADSVVLVSRARPDDALVAELQAAGRRVAAIGDALAPRNLRTAIGDGYRWESLARA